MEDKLLSAHAVAGNAAVVIENGSAYLRAGELAWLPLPQCLEPIAVIVPSPLQTRAKAVVINRQPDAASSAHH
jgi:hypothetical protein